MTAESSLDGGIGAERPLCKRPNCRSSSLFGKPINALTMKMPPGVTNGIASRKSGSLAPLPIAPGSGVRIRLPRSSLGKVCPIADCFYESRVSIKLTLPLFLPIL